MMLQHVVIAVIVVVVVVVVVVTRPFPKDGAWRKTIKHQKPGNSTGPGLESIEKQKVAKERAAQEVLSWTVQNEMRGVLGQVSAGTAGRIRDFANSREIKA